MKKRILLLALMFLLAGANVSTNAGGECCVWGRLGSPPDYTIVRRCCYWADNSCCDFGAAGAAYCESVYYSNDVFLGSDFYYVDRNEIVLLYCGWIG